MLKAGSVENTHIFLGEECLWGKKLARGGNHPQLGKEDTRLFKTGAQN